MRYLLGRVYQQLGRKEDALREFNESNGCAKRSSKKIAKKPPNQIRTTKTSKTSKTNKTL